MINDSQKNNNYDYINTSIDSAFSKYCGYTNTDIDFVYFNNFSKYLEKKVDDELLTGLMLLIENNPEIGFGLTQPNIYILVLLTLIPLGGAIIIFFYNFDTTSKNNIKTLGVIISGSIFIITLFVCIYWIKFTDGSSLFLNVFEIYAGINYSYQIFNSTLLMLIIIALITFICSCLAVEKTYRNLHTQLILYLVLECFAFNFFLSGNLFFVYFFFEISIIPIFIIIGIWGSNLRKNTAFYYIYGITGFGSILILIGLFMVYAKTGNLNTLLLLNTRWLFSLPEQTIIVSFIALGFLIKLPIIGFYNWLLEAHVEATVEGSIILSGYILKYSLWGLIFHTNIIFPKLIAYLGPFATIIIGLTIIYSIYALTLIHDFKKCIAYSSIAHMGIAYLGLSTLSVAGLEGALLTMFSHSVISPGLFIVAGILYDKYGTRNIRNLKIINSEFQIYFIILTLCNIGFPGTLSFISEILILFGILPNGNMLATSLPLSVNLLINGIFFYLINDKSCI